MIGILPRTPGRSTAAFLIFSCPPFSSAHDSSGHAIFRREQRMVPRPKRISLRISIRTGPGRPWVAAAKRLVHYARQIVGGPNQIIRRRGGASDAQPDRLSWKASSCRLRLRTTATRPTNEWDISPSWRPPGPSSPLVAPASRRGQNDTRDARWSAHSPSAACAHRLVRAPPGAWRILF